MEGVAAVYSDPEVEAVMVTEKRRPGGNRSVSRIDKAEHYQTILYEIDMLRFCYDRILMPPDGAKYGDLWAYLESFLVHYRNLLEVFSKGNETTRKETVTDRPARNGTTTDLTVATPEVIWSAESGLADRRPVQKEIDEMRANGKNLWEEYDDRSKRDDTISRYLQHCTTYRIAAKEWFPIEMMSKIKGLVENFERFLPTFKPATNSAPVDREHFLGAASMSTHSGTTGSLTTAVK
jgi:hypothetical protein